MKRLKKRGNKLKIEKTDKNVSVRVPIGLYDEYLEAKEKAEGFKIRISLSAIIRNSIEEYIEKVHRLKKS